jgi:hypothetical protein
MRGNGSSKIIAQNVFATKGEMGNKLRMANHLQLCWKCQKDKRTKGGKLKFFTGGGGRIFICLECIEDKAKGGAA